MTSKMKVDHEQAKKLANYIIGHDHGDEDKLLLARAYLDARLILTKKEDARLRLAEMLRHAQFRIEQLVDQHDR